MSFLEDEMDNIVYQMVEEKKEEVQRQIKNKEICLRCGSHRADVKRYKVMCRVWGEDYLKHKYK